MMDNKTQSDVRHKKTKASVIMYLFVFFCLAFLLLEIAEAISFYLYIESGGLRATVGELWALFLFCSLGVMFLSLLVGFAAIITAIIIAILKRLSLRNFLLILFGGLLWWISSEISTYTAYGFSFYRQTESVRYFAHNELCKESLKWAQVAFREYAQKNEGELPPADAWAEMLMNSTDSHSGGVKRDIKYLAMNKNLSGFKVEQIPKDVVLVYQAKTQNSTGIPGEITAEYHYGRGALVMFGDFNVEFVKAEDFDKLRWKP